jgi:tetratricopeptide (TPR) repeat protein
MLRQHLLSGLIFVSLLVSQLITLDQVNAASNPSSAYAIVLASSPGTDVKWHPRGNGLLVGRTVYATSTTVKGKRWERLNLGFFSSREKAVRVLNDVETFYPGAWLRQVSNSEIKAASSKAIAVPVAKKAAPKRTSLAGKKTTATNSSNLTDKQLDSLMLRAKTDFKNKNYSQAIRYFTAIIDAGEHQHAKEALELLGLSRQRKGQNAHAAAIYKEYLEKYPDSEGATRVNQRLVGLMTSTQAPREKITMEADEKQSPIQTTTFGSFSQFYRKDVAETDDTDGSFTTLSQLITFLDLTTTVQSSRFDQNFRFTADDTYDFLDEDDRNSFRFIEVFYDLSSRKTGTSARFGRQALRIGGILKRFDGLSAGYQFTPGMRLNALAGYPVDIDNKTSINQHKSFYGFTFETGTFLRAWDMNLFFFDQDIDGLDDRTSVGTEIRYNDNTKSVFGMIDYDLEFKEINILQFNANLLLNRGRTAYMNAFMRKTPVLATSNALIGRQEGSIERLRDNLNIEQIYQLARDRTADSRTITIGASQPITEKFRTNADITFSSVDGTVESGGVPATPSTGTDYFLSAQIVGNNLILKRDTGVLGLRYFDTRLSNTYSLIANTRIPVSRNWRINPRLQFDIRKSSDGRQQNKIRALIRTDYRYLNKARFDFEVGYDDTSEDMNGTSLGTNNLFVTVGYRWDF